MNHERNFLIIFLLFFLFTTIGSAFSGCDCDEDEDDDDDKDDSCKPYEDFDEYPRCDKVYDRCEEACQQVGDCREAQLRVWVFCYDGCNEDEEFACVDWYQCVNICDELLAYDLEENCVEPLQGCMDLCESVYEEEDEMADFCKDQCEERFESGDGEDTPEEYESCESDCRELYRDCGDIVSNLFPME